MKIHELLSDRKHWMKGAYAADKKGNIVSANSTAAYPPCLI